MDHLDEDDEDDKDDEDEEEDEDEDEDEDVAARVDDLIINMSTCWLLCQNFFSIFRCFYEST